MTEATTVYTRIEDSSEAGRALGLQLLENLSGHPDVVVAFVSPSYDQAALLYVLKQTCHSRFMIGCSSAGEFTSRTSGSNMASAAALRSDEMLFSISVGRQLRSHREEAVIAITGSLQGLHDKKYKYRSALVLADGLAGCMDELVEQLTQKTQGRYQFFGGGAGDNATFVHTPVFYEDEVLSDAVVCLEILSHKPLGLGAHHGWKPVGPDFYVTEARDNRLIRLNNRPVLDIYQEYAQMSGIPFDPNAPLVFFLHHMLGINAGLYYKLRLPLSIEPDGSFLLATEIPEHATVRLMRSSLACTLDATTRAVQIARQRLYGSKPAMAFFFDCVATRLRLGNDFSQELATLQLALNPINFAGCNTHGQIARAEGQFSGFHNCTAVVCLIPS